MPGIITLAEWQERFEQLTLITQNIDNLHFEAGSRDVIELHGNILRVRCENCGAIERTDKTRVPGIPICESCGGRMRPDVVLFGEMLPTGTFELATEKAAQCDLFFVIGTSAMVYPAASLPEIAKRSGAFLVEVNPEVTPLSPLANEVLKGKAAETLPGII